MYPDRFTYLGKFVAVHSHAKRYLALLLLLLWTELAGVFFIHANIIPQTPYIFAGLIDRDREASRDLNRLLNKPGSVSLETAFCGQPGNRAEGPAVLPDGAGFGA